jgi:hypothetical protein
MRIVILADRISQGFYERNAIMAQQREPIVVNNTGNGMAVAVVAVVVLVVIALLAAVALVGANAWFANTNSGNPAAPTDMPPPTSEPLLTVPAPGSMLSPQNSPYGSGAS